MIILWHIIGFICFLICFVRLEVYFIKKSITAFKELKEAREQYNKAKKDLEDFIK